METTYSYRNVAGTTLNLGDDTAASVAPGFPIQFGNSSFNTVFVSSNGNLNFSAPSPYFDYENLSLPIPSNSPMSSLISTLVAPFWDDLLAVAGTNNNVFWAVTGQAGNRELVIEWRNVWHFGCTAYPEATVRFQVVFFEGKSDILFNYADTAIGSNCENLLHVSLDSGASATVGVQNGPGAANTFSMNLPALRNGMALLWTRAGTSVTPTPPLLRVTPASLNFGSIAVGATADQILTVTNAGGGTLTGSASIATSDFCIVKAGACSASGDSFSLAAGVSQSVTVRFSPASSGSKSGSVSFASNGGNASQAVTGTGVAKSIQVLAPNGGESWRSGTNKTLCWSGAGIAGNVQISLSRDGGTTWSTIFSSVSSTATGGTRTWTVSRPTTTRARIRICTLPLGTSSSVCDTSNANFVIR